MMSMLQHACFRSGWSLPSMRMAVQKLSKCGSAEPFHTLLWVALPDTLGSVGKTTKQHGHSTGIARVAQPQTNYDDGDPRRVWVSGQLALGGVCTVLPRTRQFSPVKFEQMFLHVLPLSYDRCNSSPPRNNDNYAQTASMLDPLRLIGSIIFNQLGQFNPGFWVVLQSQRGADPEELNSAWLVILSWVLVRGRTAN